MLKRDSRWFFFFFFFCSAPGFCKLGFNVQNTYRRICSKHSGIPRASSPHGRREFLTNTRESVARCRLTSVPVNNTHHPRSLRFCFRKMSPWPPAFYNTVAGSTSTWAEEAGQQEKAATRKIEFITEAVKWRRKTAVNGCFPLCLFIFPWILRKGKKKNRHWIQTAGANTRELAERMPMMVRYGDPESEDFRLPKWCQGTAGVKVSAHASTDKYLSEGRFGCSLSRGCSLSVCFQRMR